MTDPVQRYTDLTFGLLLLVALVSVFFVENAASVGFGIGIFIAYAVHVGSEMVEFSRKLDSVEKSAENAEERSEEVVEKVEETVEKVEEATERVEETQETVEDVDEKTGRVEEAVNGDHH